MKITKDNWAAHVSSTKGAMRAAIQIEEQWAAVGEGDAGTAPKEGMQALALVIDRETNGPLMLDELRQAATDLEAAAEFFEDDSHERAELMRQAARVRAAIHAAENGDS